MQINALNSVNFAGKTQPADNQRRASFSNQNLQENMDLLDEVVAKANSNVHPSTIVYTALGTVATGLAAVKFTKFGRKAIVTLGENVAKLAAKAGAGFNSKFKKVDVDANALAGKIDKITQRSEELRNGSSNRLITGLHNFVEKVFDSNDDKTKSQVFDTILDKAGVKKDVNLIDVAAGATAGALMLDPASDALENNADRRDILDAVESIASLV